LAINNITKIEGLKFCESLHKLDLTLNFIEAKNLKSSLEELAYCEQLREIYLTGNPCTDWPRYKEYIMAKLKSIARIDGEDVTKSMVIKAKQDMHELESELECFIDLKNEEKKVNPPGENDYTPESRTQMYQEMED